MDDGVVVVAHVDAFLALFILFRDGVRQLAEHLKPFLSFLTSRNVDAALRLQANDKVSSFAELALHADCSSAGLDDVMADAEAKTDSLFVSVGRVLQLAEVEEKLLLVLLRDATALVSDGDGETDQLLFDVVVYFVDLFVGGDGLLLFHLGHGQVNGDGAIGRRELDAVR